MIETIMWQHSFAVIIIMFRFFQYIITGQNLFYLHGCSGVV